MIVVWEKCDSMQIGWPSNNVSIISVINHDFFQAIHGNVSRKIQSKINQYVCLKYIAFCMKNARLKLFLYIHSSTSAAVVVHKAKTQIIALIYYIYWRWQSYVSRQHWIFRTISYVCIECWMKTLPHRFIKPIIRPYIISDVLVVGSQQRQCEIPSF